MQQISDLTLDVSQQIEINAVIGDVYRALVRRLTDENSTPDNQSMPMILEEWPGGRWFRDLGSNQGHLWGSVQVIKPPALIEIQGPLFMSYAVAGHVQFRLTEMTGRVMLSVRHRAFGMIEDEHRAGLVHGWRYLLDRVKQRVE